MHEGHRDRMRERIIKTGIDGLQPHEVLEFLLYHVIPRKDTNEIAHFLLEKYGTLSAVFTAEYNDLLTVKDITANAALFLTSLPGVFKMYLSGLNTEKQKMITRGDVVKLLKAKFLGDTKERFFMLCLDAQNQVLNTIKVTEGGPAEVSVDARKVVEYALQNRAVSIIIAHNHPSGETSPSREDIELTRAITVALELVKVRLIDHYIFGGDRYYSFSEDGLVDVISRDVNRFLKEGLKY